MLACLRGQRVDALANLAIGFLVAQGIVQTGAAGDISKHDRVILFHGYRYSSFILCRPVILPLTPLAAKLNTLTGSRCYMVSLAIHIVSPASSKRFAAHR